MAQSDVIEFAWEIATKHLSGQHNQKKHGNRGARVSQAAQAHDFSTIDGLVRFARSVMPATGNDWKQNRKLEIELYSKHPRVNAPEGQKPAAYAGVTGDRVMFGKENSDGLVELMATGQMNDRTARALSSFVHEILHTGSGHMAMVGQKSEETWAEEAIVESLARKSVEPYYANINALRDKSYEQNVSLLRRFFSNSEIEKLYTFPDSKRIPLIKNKIKDEFAKNAERLKPGFGEQLRKDIKNPIGMLHKPLSDWQAYDKVTKLRLFLNSVDVVMGLKSINWRDY